jgi:ABC-type uncharacterized transport system involved in gliding motility auxiliary subunit
MIFLKRNALWIGLGCLVIGAFVNWSPWQGMPFKWVLLVVGSFLLFIALTLNAEELRGLLDLRATRYGAGAAVLALLALGVVAFANAVSYRHSYRWDLTENRRNSLSPQTIQILRTLKTPVNAIAFFRSDTPGKRTAEDLLNQYASYSSGKFTWRIEDTDRAVALARQYNVDSYGTVVLESGSGPETKTEKVLDAEEEKLINALVKVTRSGKRIVYVIKGHGEREIGNTDKSGFSQAKDQMDKANYEVKELVLARDPKIPEDAAIVLVPGPRTDLFPQELSALDAYIARGGKVFFMATPFQGEGLVKYLARYGVGLDDDVVIELNPLGQLFGTGPLVPIVNQYDSHPITRDMAGVMTLFPLTRSLEAAKAPPKGVQIETLARTSRQSWGETDKSVFQKGTAKPDPGEKTGPLPVALVATIEPQGDAKAGAKPVGADEKKTPKARIVVVGTADFASNQFLGAQGNRDFFLNVVSWLAEQEDLISVRAKDTRQNPIVLTAAQSSIVLWVPLALLPGAVIVCGIVVIVQRRRSK